MSCSQIEHPEVICGPLKVRPMSLIDLGYVVPAHTHDFDHVTFCVAGAVCVNLTAPDGTLTTKELLPGDFINVPAEAQHEIVGREANSRALCVFVNTGNVRDSL